jgi:hypothetical protein
MKRAVLIMVAAMLTVLSLSAAAAADSDPFIGTWTLDIRNSHYDAGELPQAMRIVIEAQDDAVHYRSETRFASGRTTTAEYTADYQEHLAPVQGDHGLLLPVTVKRLNPRTQLVSYVSGLQIVATSTRSVSPDGRRLTITTISKDGGGQPHTNIGIYVKSL